MRRMVRASGRPLSFTAFMAYSTVAMEPLSSMEPRPYRLPPTRVSLKGSSLVPSSSTHSSATTGTTSAWVRMPNSSGPLPGSFTSNTRLSTLRYCRPNSLAMPSTSAPNAMMCLSSCGGTLSERTVGMDTMRAVASITAAWFFRRLYRPSKRLMLTRSSPCSVALRSYAATAGASSGCIWADSARNWLKLPDAAVADMAAGAAAMRSISGFLMGPPAWDAAGGMEVQADRAATNVAESQSFFMGTFLLEPSRTCRRHVDGDGRDGRRKKCKNIANARHALPARRECSPAQRQGASNKIFRLPCRCSRATAWAARAQDRRVTPGNSQA